MTKHELNENRRRNALMSLCASVATFLIGAITATALPFIVGLVGTPIAALLLLGYEANND